MVRSEIHSFFETVTIVVWGLGYMWTKHVTPKCLAGFKKSHHLVRAKNILLTILLYCHGCHFYTSHAVSLTTTRWPISIDMFLGKRTNSLFFCEIRLVPDCVTAVTIIPPRNKQLMQNREPWYGYVAIFFLRRLALSPATFFVCSCVFSGTKFEMYLTSQGQFEYQISSCFWTMQWQFCWVSSWLLTNRKVILLPSPVSKRSLGFETQPLIIQLVQVFIAVMIQGVCWDSWEFSARLQLSLLSC